MHESVHRKVVVGVDGSENSLRALRWAVAEAEKRKARIVAVNAWEEPFLGELATKHDYEFAREEYEHRATKAIREAIGHVGVPHSRVEAVVLHGAPAAMLVAAAQEADLLVVGSRGRGGFASLLLGSVSAGCAQLAPCPVVIVPANTTVPD